MATVGFAADTAGMRRYRAVSARAAVTIVGIAGLMLGVYPSSSATTSTPSSTAVQRYCEGCATTYAGDLSRYGYVIMHSDEAWQIPALKAKNPDLKVILYKDVSATYSWSATNGADDQYLASGVGYAYSEQQHPEWFLKDTNGNRIEFSDYPEMWMMDWGDPSYQQMWAQNVIADSKAHGWDGVFLDDVNWNQHWHLDGRTIAKYPTNADQQESMRQFLAYVGPELTKNGLLAFPNIAVEWPDGPTIWKQWLTYVNGAAQEYWTKWGSGTDRQFTGVDWDYGQEFLRITQAAGKPYIGIFYAPPTDTRSMAYARASFLLDWDGGPSAVAFDPNQADPWNPSWTIDVGRPVSAKYQVGSTWRRDYEKGIALVNPSTATTTVQLGGTYWKTDGTAVSSVTLGPATGAVLTATAASPPPAVGSIDSRVAYAADDAEENLAGAVTRSSSDLDMMLDGTSSTNTAVGLRFGNLEIPHGVHIDRAYVQFEADETGSAPTLLTLRGQAADDPGSFSGSTGEISSKPVTSASVSWSVPAWTTVGEASSPERTPDVSGIVQEIVDRPGWAGGHALVLIVTGAAGSQRVARSFDASPSGAAVLHVEWTTSSGSSTGQNHAPVVNAGQDGTVTLPSDAALTGTVQDDGVPTAGYAVTWSKASGPGTATFSTPTATATRASFSAAGTYVLRLTAVDTGGLSAYDELTVSVTQANAPPVVDAGLDQSVTVPGPAALTGTVVDDGVPTSGVTLAWTRVSGPGNVAFASPASASTNATFSAAGTYVLRLTATDQGQLAGSDDLTVTVLAGDLIFADSFETGDVSAWSAAVTDGGHLAVDGTAALSGARGLRALIADTGPQYVTDTSPAAERTYRARFAFDPNTVSMGRGDTHSIFRALTASGSDAFSLELRFQSGSYQVRPSAVTNGGGVLTGAWTRLADAPHALEIDWTAATSGANDGRLSLWVDNVFAAGVTGVDDDTVRVDSAQLGAVSGLDRKTRGTEYFDAFESRR